MAVIASQIERRMDSGSTYEITLTTPGSNSTIQLIAGLAPVVAENVERAVRLAYNQGRQDAAKEVQATLRGVLGL